MKLDKLTFQLQSFLAARPTMKLNNTAARIRSLLTAEGEEFCEAVVTCQDPELKSNPESIFELTDIIIFSISLLQAIQCEILVNEQNFPISIPINQVITSMCEAITKLGMMTQIEAEMEQQMVATSILHNALFILSTLVDDSESVCLQKVEFNRLRYPANRFQNGDFDTARRYCKDRAKILEMEETFYRNFAAVEANSVLN